MTSSDKPQAPETSGNSKVARAATQDTSLKLDQAALLGTFGKPDKPEALIRLPAGKILKVKPGDKTTIGKVVSISSTALVLSNNGRSIRLAMPR